MTTTTRPNLPDTWSLMPLRKLGETYSGLTGKSKEDFGSGKPYVSYMNIYSNPSISLDDMELVLVKDGENQNTVRYGDIFFTTSSETPEEVGISSVLLEEPPEELYLNSFCFGLRLFDFNSLTPEYAKHLFRSQIFRKDMFELAQGASRYNLSKNLFLKVKIPLPPLPEQKRIVRILETWDEAERLICDSVSAKETRLRWLKGNLLSAKFRLPGFTYPWLNIEIGEVASLVTRLNTEAYQYAVLSCTKYDGLVRSLEYFGRKVFGDDLSKYKVVKRGEFAYATNHIEEGSIGYQNICENALVSPMYTVFKTDNRIDDYFLYHLLKEPRMIYLYQSNMSGSIARRGGLRWDTFASLPIFLPTIDEQTAIAKVIQTAESEINVERQKLSALMQEKHYLLNNLVTGKIRVPESVKA